MRTRDENKWVRYGLACLAFLVVAVGSIRNIFNSDVWWHLACGRWMVEHRQVMFRDPFTFTVPGHFFTNFEWLFQVGLYLAYHTGHLRGMLIFKALLFGLSALGLFRCLSRSLPAGVRMGLVLLVFWISRFHNMVRADLVTLCLFPWMLSLLIDDLKKPAAPLPLLRWHNGLLLIGFCLWANGHAGFWLMGVPLGLAALTWIQCRPQDSRHFLKNPFIGAALFFFIAITLTPYGWKLPFETYRMSRQLLSGAGAFFYETLPPSFHHYKAFWIVLAFTWLAKLVAQRHEKRVDAWSWGLLVYATWLGQLFVRNIPLTLMMSAIVLSRSLATIAAPYIKDYRWDRYWNALAGLTATGLLISGLLSMEWGLDQKRYPIAATDFIQRRIPERTGYNDFNFGGYLMWRFYDEKRPIFIDSRCAAIDGYWNVFLEARRATEFSPEALSNWQDLLARWPVDWCLMGLTPRRLFYKGMPLSVMSYYFPRQTWALVFRDGETALYVRRIEALRKMIDQCEIKNVYPDCDTATPVAGVAWKDLFVS